MIGDPHPPISLFALETYSLIGGLQNFNRRVISSLDELRGENSIGRPRATLLRDAKADLPPFQNVSVEGYPSSRPKFMAHGVRSAVASGGTLIIGHINLLPLAFAAKQLRGSLKTLLFVHGDEAWNVKRRPRRWYEPGMLRSIDMIAAVSDHTADRMSAQYGVTRGKFRLLPNAVDPLEPAPRSPGATPRAITVSRIGAGDREKRVDEVIKAVGILKARGCDMKLDVIGDGVLRPELSELAAGLGLSDRVRFHGRVSDAELQSAYGSADLFVLPSTKEGFGIVYLEAWQHGLPVICSTEGAAHEIISEGEDGFAVKPGDLETLADRIWQLASDPAQARGFGEAGSQKVKQHYLQAHFRKNLKTLLDELEANR